MFKRLQVVKRNGRVGLDPFHKRGDVGLILEGHLELRLSDRVGVEVELKLDVDDVVLVLIIDDPDVLRVLPVLDDHPAAVGPRADPLLLELPLDLGEAFARTTPGYEGVGSLEPNTYQPPTHREVIILE